MKDPAMKTSDLVGPALDWAVAKIEGVPVLSSDFNWKFGAFTNQYSTSWEQGGPIIEREEISIKYVVPAMRDSVWQAFPSITAKGAGGRWGVGPTPLIAAMRCYVASKLGDEIEIPSELQP